MRDQLNFTCPPGFSELPTTQTGWKQFTFKTKNGRVSKLRLEQSTGYRIQLPFDLGRYAIFDERSTSQIMLPQRILFVLPLCALQTLKIGEYIVLL